MLITKNIDVRFLCGVRMPAKIKIGDRFQHLPVMILGGLPLMHNVNKLAFLGSRNHIAGSAVSLPLGSKLIDVGRIARVGTPGIVHGAVVNDIRRDPVFEVGQQPRTSGHVLALSGARHTIFQGGHLFCRPVLIAPHIDVGRVSGVWSP